jgi:protein-disulfide isomerase
MNSDKLIFTIIGGITVVILAIIFVTSFKTTTSLTKELVLGENPYYKGQHPENAKLIVVEFSDFECPFCAQYPPIFSALVESYPEELSVVYRHFPLPIHRFANISARAAEAAGMQGKFWEYHDELFINQPNFANQDLERYAENIGLDMDRFRADLASETSASNVNNDSSDSRSLRLNSTPTFFVIYDGRIEKVTITKLEDLENKVKEVLGESKITNSSEDVIPSGPDTSLPVEADLTNLNSLYALAVSDLSKNDETITTENIKLETYEAVEWSDSSLGCPEDGKFYSQVITSGYRLTLSANGKSYIYHTNLNDTVVNCTK